MYSHQDQTYSIYKDHKIYTWQVAMLYQHVETQPVIDVAVCPLVDQEKVSWFNGHDVPLNEVAHHIRRVVHANCHHPILLAPNGRIIDGMHRLLQAYLANKQTLKAKRLMHMPQPESIRNDHDI